MHTTWGKDLTDGLHLLFCQCDVEGFQRVSEMIGMGGADDGEQVRIFLQHPRHSCDKLATKIGKIAFFEKNKALIINVLRRV